MTENTARQNCAFGMSLKEPNGSFFLGTDAFLLSAYLKSNPKYPAVELGAGSGIISLLAARKKAFSKIFSVEIQPALYEAMKQNVADNGFDDIIEPINSDVRELDISKLVGVRTVFANPPYMKVGCGKSNSTSEKEIARHEVFGGIDDFCRAAGKILQTGGRFYTVYRPDRLESLMASLKANGFSPKRITFVHATPSHAPSSVLTEAMFDAKESLTVTRPLFINSEDYSEIYETGTFPADFFIK